MDNLVRPNFQIKTKALRAHQRVLSFVGNQSMMDEIAYAMHLLGIDSRDELIRRALESFLQKHEGSFDPHSLK